MSLNRCELALLLMLPIVAFGCSDSTGVPPDPTPTDCTPANSVGLAVGESREFRGANARRLCVAGGSSGSDFVLVAFSADTSSANRTDLRIRGEGLSGVTFPPQPSPGQGGAALGPLGVAPSPASSRTDASASAHARIRALERSQLGPLVQARRRTGSLSESLSARTLGPAAIPNVDDLLTFNAQSSVPCSSPIMRTGRVRAVSSRAIVVADTLNPPGGFDTAQYEHFAITFDTLIAPVAEQNFGAASDLDGNARVILFYTQEVNRLTPSGSDSFVGGFFFARDLFPKTATQGLGACAASNVAEILYLLVPDPGGAVNGNERSIDFVRQIALTALVHEYQHLINAAQRLHIFRSSTPFEETWLDEGLAHLAEELLFYRASGTQPRQNLGIHELRDAGQRAIDAVNLHQLSNVFRLRRYLIEPHSNSPYATEDKLATRGATWHFLRYALDRKGGNEAATLRPMVASHSGGYLNLANAFGGPTVLQEWLTDWSVALYADDRVPGIAPQQRDRSWNHDSLYATLFPDSVPTYPLRTEHLSSGRIVSVNVIGGGSGYLRFGVAAGGEAQVDVTAANAAPPETTRLTLMRTR